MYAFRLGRAAHVEKWDTRIQESIKLGWSTFSFNNIQSDLTKNSLFILA